MTDWRALGTWTPSTLAARFGDRRVNTYASRDGELMFDRTTGLVAEQRTLAELTGELEGPTPARHRVRSRLLDEVPELLGEVKTPCYCRRGHRLEPNLWMSAPNTRSRLHFDQPETLLAQLHGTKRIILFPPSDRRYLYAESPFSPIAQFSRADLASPDLGAFPALSRAHPQACELRPGEMLYMPGGFWHYVESREATISVGFRWWRLCDVPILLAAELWKRARGHVH
jgi:lysine-specific demethylase 8